MVSPASTVACDTTRYYTLAISLQNGYEAISADSERDSVTSSIR